MKAIYIGAGFDLEPIIAMKDTTEFVFVDSLPYTEFPDTSYETIATCANFVERLQDKMNKNGFYASQLLTNLSSKQYIDFRSKNNTHHIRYYINTVFPRDVSTILYDLQTSQYLIVKGFNPDPIILKYMRHPTIVMFSDSMNSDFDTWTPPSDIPILFYKKEYVAYRN